MLNIWFEENLIIAYSWWIIFEDEFYFFKNLLDLSEEFIWYFKQWWYFCWIIEKCHHKGVVLNLQKFWIVSKNDWDIIKRLIIYIAISLADYINTLELLSINIAFNQVKRIHIDFKLRT